jgi:hypothetical protein
MKICVLMFFDENIKEYAEINYKINKLYCEKYGFDIIFENNRHYTNRHPAWERLPLILNNITNYDYVIWIDADAFFYVDSPNIVNLIEKYKDKNIIFSNDKPGSNNINTGVLIIKNCEYNVNFIKFWAYDKHYYDNNKYPFWWDQGVLITLYNKNISNIKNNSIVLDFGILQSFDTNEDSARPFILHCAGKSSKKRLNVSSDYYNIILLQKHYNFLTIGAKYTWEAKNMRESGEIIFLKNGKMNAFGNGEYFYVDNLTIKANFGTKSHILVFSDDYSKFTSTRKDDNNVVVGTIIPSYNFLTIGVKYTWENNVITFLENGIMNAFGYGEYYYINNLTIRANFGTKSHKLVFSDDYKKFTSTRKDDNNIVVGTLITE